MRSQDEIYIDIRDSLNLLKLLGGDIDQYIFQLMALFFEACKNDYLNPGQLLTDPIVARLTTDSDYDHDDNGQSNHNVTQEFRIKWYEWTEIIEYGKNENFIKIN